MLRGLFLALILFACAAAPSRARAQTAIPDVTYGAGGSRITATRTAADGTITTAEAIRDRSGVTRERVTTETTSTGERAVEREWFDPAGALIRRVSSKADAAGRQYSSCEEAFRNGAIVAGDRYEERNGAAILERFDTTTGRYAIVPDAGIDLVWTAQLRGPIRLVDAISLYGVAISEDWLSRQFTIGATVSYTYAMGATWGLTGDFQWIRGGVRDVTDSTFQILAGVSFWQHRRGDFFVAPRVLAGLARTRSLTVPSGAAAPTHHESAFALAIGVDFGTQIFGPIDLAGRVEYTPTFLRGRQHHAGAGMGVRIRF